MDFVRILRSLEEFLYEVMTWIVFYPSTLLRTAMNPTAMAQYTKMQLAQDKERQFMERVSPVLMLIISLLLAHGAEMAANRPIQIKLSPLASLLFGTPQGLLATRSIVFSLYALLAALVVMKRARVPVTRETLREPFFIQCYLVSPFVLLLSAALILGRVPDPWVAGTGALFLGVAVVWYVGAQSSVYRHLLGIKAGHSILLTIVGFLGVTALILGTLVIILGVASKVVHSVEEVALSG